jgi:hypothetical protein
MMDPPAFITLGKLPLRIVPQHYPEDQSCEPSQKIISPFSPSESSPESSRISPLVLLLIPWKEFCQELLVSAILAISLPYYPFPWA